MTEAFVSIVAVEETPDGPRDIDSIDGEDVRIKTTVDGEVFINNGFESALGGGQTWFRLDELIGDRELGRDVRLEVRIVYKNEPTGEASERFCDHPDCPGRSASLPVHEIESGPEVHDECVAASRPGFFPNGQCRHHQLLDGWVKVWCIRTDDGHTEHETAAGEVWSADR